MNRTLTLAVTTLLAIASSAVPVTSIATASDLLSPTEAQRLGMVEAWHRQIGAIGGARSIVDMQLWVQKDTQREYVEVYRNDPEKGPQVLERIATDLRDPLGNPIGKPEAERRAKLSVLKLKRRSIEAEIRALSVDQVRLYVLLQNGLLSAYDAETGEQLWSLRLGNPSLGYTALGIDDRFVTVINGTTMYQVRASDTEVVDEDGVARRLPAGRPLQPTRLDHIPLHGATHSGELAIVPITQNGIETYRLDGGSIQPGFEMFTGQALAKPAVYPHSTRIMWPTDRDFVYAMETDGRPSMLFRLATQGMVEGGVTASSGLRFFFGSTGGRVYGVRATRTGQVLWNQSLGEPFYQAPLVSGDQVLISSGYGNLHSLAADTGLPTWERPATGVDLVFAHVGDQLVGRDRDHYLILIDANSGERRHTIHRLFVQYPVVNHDTDRFYLVGSSGTVQCLRPVDHELPLFRREIELEPVIEEEPEEEKPVAPAQETPQSDPFGSDQDAPADPFGGGADPFGGGADPFGGGADPFGGGGDGEDPFGN